MMTLDQLTAQIEAILTRLSQGGYAVVTIPVRGGSPKRLTIMGMAETREIMFALEGHGCIFITETDRVNKFNFITAGFPIDAADIAVAIFTDLARVRVGNHRAQPQLEDKRS